MVMLRTRHHSLCDDVMMAAMTTRPTMMTAMALQWPLRLFIFSKLQGLGWGNCRASPLHTPASLLPAALATYV